MCYIFLFKKSGNVSIEENIQKKDQEEIEPIPFDEMLKLLDEMDLDLVFHDFKKVASSEKSGYSKEKGHNLEKNGIFENHVFQKKLVCHN